MIKCYCPGINCNRKQECLNHVCPVSNFAKDFSIDGVTSYKDNNILFACGDNSADYALFDGGLETMRLWHVDMLPYLPDLQFRGQLRELVAIMHDWRDKGKTNHLLINKVMEYPVSDFYKYFLTYANEWNKRYTKIIDEKYYKEFADFCGLNSIEENTSCFKGWHNKDYLRVCMANLYEKYNGVGSSKVTEDEWNKLCEGYKKITHRKYKI